MLDAGEHEELVVGACLLSMGAYHRVSGFLAPSMFANRLWREAYGCIAELSERASHVDIATVARYVAGQSAEVRPRLVLAADKARDETEHVADWGAQILDAHRRRQAREIAEGLLKRVQSADEDVSIALEEAQDALIEVTATDRAGERTLSEVASSIVARVEQNAERGRPDGIETGIYSLDDMLGPIMRDEFLVIGGPSQSGKTALAMQAAMNIAQAAPVLFVALDQKPEPIAQRVLAANSDVSLRAIRSAEVDVGGLERMALTAERLRAHDVRLLRRRQMTVEDIRSHAVSLARTKGCAAVVVDHLKQVRTRQKHRSEFERMHQVVADLSDLPTEIGAPVILLSQLTRSSQRADDPTPSRHDLYGGGAIDEGADMVVLLWRPERSEQWRARRRDEDEADHSTRLISWQGKAELILDKHRSADAPARRRVRYDGPRFRFLEDD